jgi:putative glutamine amidotransferase
MKGAVFMRPIIGITCTTADSTNAIGISYISAIENAGGTPILLPLVQNNSCTADFLSVIDGLLLSGGVDADPFLYGEEPRPALGRIDVDKDRVEMSLIAKTLEIDLPILGICRGIQILNVAAGGTLYQDISMYSSTILKHRQDAPRSYATHAIEVQEGNRLLDILGQSSIRVNSFHHQAVRKAAPGFIVSAIARDGIVEGIESAHHSFAIGVQFHPELMWQNNPPITALFVAFVSAAKAYKAATKSGIEELG